MTLPTCLPARLPDGEQPEQPGSPNNASGTWPVLWLEETLSQLVHCWQLHNSTEVLPQESKLSHAMMGTHILPLIDVGSNPEHYAHMKQPQGSHR